MFGFTKQHPQRAPLVGPVLRQLSDARRAVRMEIDSAMVRFNTGLSVKDGVVVVCKPKGLETSMNTGDIVRFKIPWEKKFEVRMEISVLHVNLKNGMEAFICEEPTGPVYFARRDRDRFNTRRFADIYLDVPALRDMFPILDLSSAGCRVDAEPNLVRKAFGVNRRLWGGTIIVGGQLRVPLAFVIPRAYHNETVGLEFKVNREGQNGRRLTNLLGILATREVQRQSFQSI